MNTQHTKTLARLTGKALRNLPKHMTLGLTEDCYVIAQYVGKSSDEQAVFNVTQSDGKPVGPLHENCLKDFVYEATP